MFGRVESQYTTLYPTKIKTEADDVDDLVLLANTPARADSILNSQEHEAGSISFRMIANKTEYLSFKREGTISTLTSRPLKLVYQSTYLGSNISSAESDVNLHLAKVWTAIDRLSIIWKSDLSDKIKRDFFLSCVCVSTTVLMHHVDAIKTHREETRWELHKNATCSFEQILETTFHKTAAVRPLTSHHKIHLVKTNSTCSTLLENQGQSYK